MTDWTAGYVADIGYTFGYYAELNPMRVKLAFLNKGLAFPETGAACELGFGQGISANFHAAASITEWHGTDFNPAQAGFAQDLAKAAGVNARLFDDAFADFAKREDLPDFDYIGLHGIWSWISDENRAVIVDFVRRKLKVGGVLYVSYNTLPGWATFAPIRHLMTEHAEVIGSEGKGTVSRIDDAIDFAEKLIGTNPMFARVNPTVAERIKKLKSQNRHYLAHEYFNRDWHPMHFSTMADWLEPAKVSFACSANYLDSIDAINLSSEQQAFLKEFTDERFRESVRDFMVNQQFRKDYWVKGPRRLNALDRVEALGALRVILTTHRPDVPLKMNGAMGEVTLSEKVYSPYLDLLADHKPRSFAEIERALQSHDINLPKIIEASMVLSASGHLALVQDDEVVEKAKKHTQKLNAHICSLARGTNDIAFLASPVTGGGVPVIRFHQVFVLAITEGLKQPSDWAQMTWDVLNRQGQRLIKEGKSLESAEENLKELNEQAQAFAKRELPILKALKIV